MADLAGACAECANDEMEISTCVQHIVVSSHLTAHLSVQVDIDEVSDGVQIERLAMLLHALAHELARAVVRQGRPH